VYKQILVATDGSDLATKAVSQAGELASRLGAELTIVTVTEQLPTFASSELGWSVPDTVFDDIRKANAQRSRNIMAQARDAARVPCKGVHVEDTSPYQGIIDTADAYGADLIVVGSRGHRGLDQLLLGSQASKVLSLAKVPVLVVR